MGCNNSKQNIFEIIKKRDKIRLTKSSIKHGDKLYYNESELFLAVNKPIEVFDTKIFSKNNQTNTGDSKISYKFKNFHVIFLNTILNKLIFNTSAFSSIFKMHVDSPFKYGLLNYEEILIITADNKKLHAFFIKQFDSLNSMTIFYLHGNTGNIGISLSHAKKLFSNLKSNILLIDYRGYGYSTDDKISEGTCYLDAKAGLDFLSSRSDIDLKKICVIGYA